MPVGYSLLPTDTKWGSRKIKAHIFVDKKRFQPELKVEDTGDIRSTIATLNVIDKDGDVTLPGFFGDQPASVLVAHDWGMVPVGKGRVFDDGVKGVFEGRLNLKDANARTVHEWLKFDLEHDEPLQEWSYGFTLKPGGHREGDHDGQEVRFLQPVDGGPGADVHEVSLVIVGAGEGTNTQSVKSRSLRFVEDDDHLRFSEHADRTLTAVDEFTKRARSLADLRATDNRTLSEPNLIKLARLHAQLAGLIGPEPDMSDPSADQYELIMESTLARMAGRI